MAGTISKAIITSQTASAPATIAGGTITNPSVSEQSAANGGLNQIKNQLMMQSQLLNTVPQVMGLVPMTACCGQEALQACVAYPIILEASTCISFTVTGTCSYTSGGGVIFKFYNPNTGQKEECFADSPKNIPCSEWANIIAVNINTMASANGSLYHASSSGCVVTVCITKGTKGQGSYVGATLNISNVGACPTFSQTSFTFGSASTSASVDFNFSATGTTTPVTITYLENSSQICTALANSINSFGTYTASCTCQTIGDYTPATVIVPGPYITMINVNTVDVYITITCGSTNYVYPMIVIPAQPEITQLQAIVNLINYEATYPFTATYSGHYITISSTEGASQNGCFFNYNYRGYNASGDQVAEYSGDPTFAGGISSDITTTCNLTICAPAGTSFNGQTVTLQQSNGQLITVANPTQTFTGGQNATTSNNCPDCREGTYQDLYNNDLNFVLPVFCNPASPSDLYTNDWNTWMFTFSTGYDPIVSGAFQIQEYVSGNWVTVATITDNTFGIAFNQTPFYPFLATGNNQIFVPVNSQPVPPGYTIVSPSANPSSPSTSNNYCGYALSWLAVYNKFGAGLYRFYMSGSYDGAGSFCSQSPPFCLKAFNCDTTPQLMDRTVKFEMEYLGGNTGDVNPADYNHNGQGNYWPLVSNDSYGTTISLAWYDSVRFPGFFGKSTFDYTRERITYATGQVYEVRDQLQRKWNLQTGNLPQWLIDRFAAYTAMADIIWVSDANINNATYNVKRNLVNVNSSVTPEYQNQTRFSRIQSMQFTDSVDFIFRDRC